MGKEKGTLRVPVQKRILLLLGDHMSSEDDYEVPETLSQKGIGKELGLRQTHVSRALSELSTEGLVRTKTAHIKGVGRRKKVYFLTKKGVDEVRRSIEEFEVTKVPVRGRDGSLKLLPISRVFRSLGRSDGKPPTMHELFTHYYDGSEIDISQGKMSTIGPKGLPLNPHFYGRRSELEIISTAVERKSAHLICIVSIAGQGKTSLLAHFASKIKNKSLVWTSIDEWTRPMSVLEDWALLLDGLGSSKTLEYIRGPKEPTMDRTVSLMIKELDGTGAVLILDDVHKSPEVQELIAMLKQRIPTGTDATIIIGTRIRPELYGKKDIHGVGSVVEIELRGLDEKSASELLRERGVPEEEHALAYKMTQGHPLALELYISGLDLDGYLWEEVTRGLSSEEREILDLACIYLQPVPAEALFPGERPDLELLHSLTDKVLLRRFGDGTYGIHDILREHLRDSMTEKETTACLERALSFLSGRGSDKDILHYIGLLSDHDRKEIGSVLLKEGDLLVSKGYDHILNLVPRIDPFSLKGPDMVRYLLLFSDLNLLEGDIGSAERKLDKALQVCDQSLRRSKGEIKRTEVLSLVSRVLYRSGEISRSKGVHTEALEAQSKNVAYNRKYGNKSGLGKALNNLALAYIDRGELDKAMKTLKEARNLLDESGDPASKAFVEASIADIYITRRDHAKAKIYLSAASSCHPRLPSIRWRLKRRTGICWMRLGDLEEAYLDLSDSYTSSKESGDRLGGLQVLLDLYDVEKERGDIKSAGNYLKRVSSGLDEIKSSKEGVRSLRLQCMRAMYEHALQFAPKSVGSSSLELADAIMENLEPKGSIFYLDRMTDELKDPELILPLLESFEKISWSRGDRNGSLVVSIRRAQILMGTGDDRKARKLLQTVQKRAVKTGFKKAAKKASILLSQL